MANPVQGPEDVFVGVWPGFIPTAMGWEYMVSYWKAELPVEWLASVLIPGQQKHQVSNEKNGPGLFRVYTGDGFSYPVIWVLCHKP